MTIHQATIIGNGTRLRDNHSTFGLVIASYNAGQTVRGNMLWIAPADGNEVKKGDQWLFVTHVNGVDLVNKGWMAITHKGVPICKDLKEVDVPTEPPVPPSLPVVAVLVDMYPEGKRVVITSEFDMGDWVVVANGKTFVPPADG